MRRSLRLCRLLCLCAIAAQTAHAQVLTAPAGKDYRLLGHPPTFDVRDARELTSDEYTFHVRSDEEHEVTVHGTRYEVNYVPRDGMPAISAQQIHEGYRAALLGLGAQITASDARNTYARLLDHGLPVWIRVFTRQTGIELVVVEEQP